MNIMRRVLGLALLVVGFFAIGYSFFATEPPRANVSKEVASFRGFERGSPVPIDLDVYWPDRIRDVNARAQDQEHLRDLLLNVILAAYEGTGTSAALALHDANAVRKAFLDTTARSQYGPTRFAVLENGLTVLLVPAQATDDERHDWIAQTADRVKVESTERPSSVAVFEYCLDDPLYDQSKADQKSFFATIQRAENVSKAQLYSDAFGYHVATVKTTNELDAFLSATDDLVSFDSVQDGLKLAGRDFRSRSYGRITSEHIATLVQSYDDINKAKSRRNRRLNALVKKFTDQWSETIRLEEGLQTLPSLARTEIQSVLSNKINELYEVYGTCGWQWLRLNIARTEQGLATGDATVSEFTIGLAHAIEAVEEKVDLAELSLLRGSIGFSLDTEYHYEVLQTHFDQFMKQLDNPIVQLIAEEEDEIRRQLGEGNAELLLCMMDAYSETDARALFRQMNAVLLDPAKYQIARYDGGLQGTEVGQILFLTDLLAKLLDFNFNNVYDAYFPSDTPGWVPTAYTSAPEIYSQQLEELPGTRIWFNLIAGAAFEEAGVVHFPTVATRVFALAQDSNSGETERQPGYLSETFVRWFNNNYDQVARVEPAYDQLNQIVKWSYATDKFQNSFGFLSSTTVRRDIYFPDWVVANDVTGADLWVNCFHQRRTWHDSLETMPVFHTGWEIGPEMDWCDGETLEKRHGARVWSFQGGVSLPRAARFSKLRPGAQEAARVPSEMRRMAMFAGSVKKSADDAFTYARVPGYNRQTTIAVVDNLLEARMISTRKAKAVRQNQDGTFADDLGSPVFNRGKLLELGDPTNTQITKYEAMDIGRLSTDTLVGEHRIASISADVGDSFARVRTTPGELAVAETVGVRLSRVPPANWGQKLIHEPYVDAFRVVDDGALVRIDGKWLEFRIQPEPTIKITDGALARASDSKTFVDHMFDLQISAVEIRSVQNSDIAGKLSNNYGMSFVRSPKADGSFVIEIRGPPNLPPIINNGVRFGEPDSPKRINLLIGKERERADQSWVVKTESETLKTNEIDTFIDSLRKGQPLSGVRQVSLAAREGSDLTWMYSARTQLMEHAVDDVAFAAKAAEHRTLRLTAIEDTTDVGEFTTASRLKRDFEADFGPLKAVERETLHRKRYAAHSKITVQTERRINDTVANAVRGSETDAARVIVDLLSESFRASPETTQKMFLGLRQNLLSSAGHTTRFGIDDGLIIGHPNCRLVPLDRRASANSIRYASANAFDIADPFATPLASGLKAMRIEPTSAQRINLGASRPDVLRIGTRYFSIEQNDRVPSFDEVVAHPAAADSLRRYLAGLLSTSLGADTGEPLEVVVMTTEEEAKSGACFVNGVADTDTTE